MFLNTIVPFEAYGEMVSDIYFVDKSELLNELFPAMGKKNRYFCITRPRRFGKSVMANMIGAFFGKGVEGYRLFNRLAIAKHEDYETHLNQHNVIFIDFSRVPENCNSYQSYISRISEGIKADVLREYSSLNLDGKEPLWDILMRIFQETREKFIFVMDEWDAVFHLEFIREEQRKEYLLFLKNLLKDQVYAELVYMTGVLPITKYSSGSELNMFVEYDMTVMERFSGYFGFSEDEVDKLFKTYSERTRKPEITRDNLREWYDGYCTASGEKLYNPRSITCALTNNQLANYWTSSGPYDEIFFYIRDNIEEIRDDLVLMVAGEGIEAEIQNYAAVSMELNTKDEVYSAMVIYGLLTYEDGKVYIPNKELMDKFRELLMQKEAMGYVYRLANESKRMLSATLKGDSKTMAEILQFAHDTEKREN